MVGSDLDLELDRWLGQISTWSWIDGCIRPRLGVAPRVGLRHIRSNQKPTWSWIDGGVRLRLGDTPRVETEPDLG
jgi:hypothetical protein